MIFFWLGLVALTFTALGFFTHAFYFGKHEFIKKLSADIQSLQNKLAFRERANSNAQDEIAKTRLLIHSIEQQLEQREAELQLLKNTAQKKDAEIRNLQKQSIESERITASKQDISWSAGAASPVEVPPAVEPEPKDTKIPLWKDSLNNILGVLDKIEKESRKQI